MPLNTPLKRCPPPPMTHPTGPESESWPPNHQSDSPLLPKSADSRPWLNMQVRTAAFAPPDDAKCRIPPGARPDYAGSAGERAALTSCLHAPSRGSLTSILGATGSSFELNPPACLAQDFGLQWRGGAGSAQNRCSGWPMQVRRWFGYMQYDLQVQSGRSMRAGGARKLNFGFVGT